MWVAEGRIFQIEGTASNAKVPRQKWWVDVFQKLSGVHTVSQDEIRDVGAQVYVGPS